jgi:Tol biopolymer transport system component
LTAKVYGAAAVLLSGRAIEWSSSSSAVTVSPDGVILAAGLGDAWVRARCEGVLDSIQVTALPGFVKSIVVTPAPVVIQAGADPIQVTATALDSLGNVVSEALTWSLDNATVSAVYVSATGMLTALEASPGPITLSVENATGVRRFVPVTVLPPSNTIPGIVVFDVFAVPPAPYQLDVFSFPAGTGALLNVTSTGTSCVNEHNAHRSRAGGRIAYETGCGLAGFPSSPTNIYSVNVDGTGRQQLTASGGDPNRFHRPTWSPDGGRIGYLHRTCCSPSWVSTVETMNPDGSGVTVLATTPEGGPAGDQLAWSPDGGQLAFLVFATIEHDIAGRGTVVRIDSDATDRVDVGFPDRHPARALTWSPNGAKLAYVTATPPGSNCPAPGCGDLIVMNPDGSGRINLTTGSTTGSYAWSPDGSKIAFTRYPASYALGGLNGISELMIANIDGSGVRSVTAPWEFGPERLFAGQGMAWSPDGSWLAFACLPAHRTVASGNAAWYGLERLCIMRQDGTLLRTYPPPYLDSRAVNGLLLVPTPVVNHWGP